MKNKSLSTPCGELIGVELENHVEYRGIRYAAAERWKYPVMTTHWDGIYDATEYGACSYQRRGFEADEICNAFYHKEFRRGMSFEYSEDCLYLNITTPKNPKNCPVIMYIHGGSFTGGSANEGHISGKAYAENGIIFVSINYRLGPYGFCSHPSLRTDDGICGNFGLYDQVAAIGWVRSNISAFGGNPQSITLMGQSAGAMSIDIHLSNPLCKGWFKGAVLMSGAALQRKLARPLAPEKTEKFWNKIIENAGCSNMEELRQVDERTLFYAWSDACDNDIMSALYTLPVCDGKIITRENFNMNTIPDMNYIIGVTSTDMVPVVLEGLTKAWIRNTDSNKCYVYKFARNLPGDDKGAWHSSDLPYAFATLEKSWRPFESIDYEISNQMVKMLCAFAANGSPDCDALPKWISGAKMPMCFCENSRPMSWQTGKMIKTTLFNRGPM